MENNKVGVKKMTGPDKDYTVPEGERTTENLTLSCMMRIADSVEILTKDWQAMKRDLDWHKKRNQELRDQVKKLERIVAAQKGLVTRIKNKVSKDETEHPNRT